MDVEGVLENTAQVQQDKQEDQNEVPNPGEDGGSKDKKSNPGTLQTLLEDAIKNDWHLLLRRLKTIPLIAERMGEIEKNSENDVLAKIDLVYALQKRSYDIADSLVICELLSLKETAQTWVDLELEKPDGMGLSL